MLIQSISGIRGTIGGPAGAGLTPSDVVRFATGYGRWLREQSVRRRPLVVVGRDARISGPMVRDVLVGTLTAMGVDVFDVGLSTTPTVELEVPAQRAQGGIILTASHNPREWNALKLLNDKGEFLSAADGERMLELAGEGAEFSGVDELGRVRFDDGAIERHVRHVLDLELVDVTAIREAGFKVALDAVNSTGGLAVPPLLEALGVECVQIHCDPTGEFPHNPEPLPGHLTDLRDAVLASRSDVGVAVDPDVDRLALVSEDGSFFGEEYTLVAVADYVLERHAAGGFAQGNNADYSQATVSNLSSTRALRTVTEEHGGSYTASAVGEVNVVDAMKASRAVIGGEGNGGVIYPASHYGRDALVGIALFLSLLARRKVTASALRAGYPPSVISKDKLALPGTGVEQALASLVAGHPEAEVNTIDGVKFDLPEGWVHLRKSNTEPIIRVYAESHDAEAAAALGNRFKSELEALLISE